MTRLKNKYITTGLKVAKYGSIIIGVGVLTIFLLKDRSYKKIIGCHENSYVSTVNKSCYAKQILNKLVDTVP